MTITHISKLCSSKKLSASNYLNQLTQMMTESILLTTANHPAQYKNPLKINKINPMSSINLS
jgi:hypothetical protein